MRNSSSICRIKKKKKKKETNFRKEQEAACPQSMQEIEILCLCDLGFEHLYLAFFNLSHTALEDGFRRFSHDFKLDYLSNMISRFRWEFV